MANPPTNSYLSLYRQIWRQVKPFWPGILAILALNLLATPLSLLAPLPLKIAIDNVIMGQPLPPRFAWLVPRICDNNVHALLLYVVSLLVGISLLSYCNGLAIWLVQTYVGQRIVMGFRSKLFRHAQRLSLQYHDSVGTSDAIYRIQYDAPAIQWIASDSVIPLMASCLTVVSTLCVMAKIDVHLMFVALAITPILLLLTRQAGKQLRNQWNNVRQYDSQAASVIQESLTALRVVKAFGQEERENRRFLNRSMEAVRSQLRVAITNGVFDLLLGLTLALGTALVIYLGVKQVLHDMDPANHVANPLTIGFLVMIMTYVGQLYPALQSMSKKYTDLQGSFAGAQRALQLLEQQLDVTDRPNALPIAKAQGRIEFKNVVFSYEQRNPVLQDVSFDISAGTRVGIVGHTGAGKSTLVSLIMRFYDPTTGSVLLDDRDLRQYKLDDLRNQYSIVLQEPVLLSSTIGENIAYAKPRATDEEIAAAAKLANAHDFISKLPEGYHTQVGERGMRLSGGERQRISLARAFLKNAPILILDEPTSSVDVVTEEIIIQAMQRLMAERTTFMIAHRLSTLQSCDVILEMSHGKLISVRKRGDPDFLHTTTTTTAIPTP